MSVYATLRHVSASGRLSSFWEYDPARRVMILRVQLGAAPPVDVDDIRVCAPLTPRPGAFVLLRTHETSWMLTQACMPWDIDRLARATPFHSLLPTGSVALIDAPPGVQRELECL